VELSELASWALGRRLGAPAPGAPVLQVKITMAEADDPPVWRRLLLPADMRLDRLHQVIQAAMGWENYRLARLR
jgi:Plasmid pRiA4b ORF-3-like protein